MLLLSFTGNPAVGLALACTLDGGTFTGYHGLASVRVHLSFVGVRDCPYGLCCVWVRGGWDLDALGKFFRRRRRRRRRPRPLLLR